MTSPTNISMQASASHWLLINVAVNNIFIGRCSMKSDLVQAHKFTKLLSFLLIGGEFHTVSWEIQGGLIVLETTSLPMAIDNYSSYLHYIGNLTSDAQQPNKGIKKAEHGNESYNLDEIDQGTVSTSQQTESRLPDAFDLSLSRFAFVLALENESGGIREIALEVDIHLKFEMATTGRKLTVDLSRLSILSQIIYERVEDEIAIPHFSSVTSKDLSSHHASADSLSGFQNFGELNSVSDASSSKEPVPVQLNHQKQILKHLRAFMSLERLDNGSLHLSRYWFGTGSLSGFDMTLSVYEVQDTIKGLEGNHWSTSHEVDNSFEAMIPDGAIVAIQDVNQHMYFTVEGEEKTFSIGGAIHYSLVGERALFRVKHCTQKRWNSTVLWFSLISLFAKNDMGVPLRLNFRPGSCFVDISFTNDGGCALWRVCHQGESYEGVTDWEACNQSVKRNFYLVNKKNNSAIAFVDGALEFVRKPGNPIKFKVFKDLCAAYDVSETASYPRMAVQACLHPDAENTEDLFPLICLFINNTQLIIQSLATKSRVISTSSAAVHYFDAQGNLWGELIHPVEICIFYRSNVQTQFSEYASHAVPVNFFCKIKELDISLNENSLDVLLFVIGKLNLSGPYSLQSSMILANCCKVENQSGLDLLFYFNQQRITIPRKQSASILLRRLSDFKNQDSEAATSVSIQLADGGSFSTNSIHLLLSQMQTLAWRTRIMSREGSRTFPGPMLVVNISRNPEVGLSFVVSPLIKIHNETGLSMELQFQRPEPKEDEFASVLLKPGDSIDDSMAMFDAINFSGGVKRALMSLSVGNFLFSFRPKMTEELIYCESSLSLEWSAYIKGGKAVRLSGIFDILNYRLRKALFVKSVKCSFSTAHCLIKSEGVCVASMHFLIQTIARDIPFAPSEKSAAVLKNENSTVSLREQKEIYLLPTVRMTNLLHSEIDVLLSDTGQSNLVGYDKIGKQATISCGSTVDFYANPAVIYFTITLTSSNSSSKPVNSGDCVKKLLKGNNDVQHLDINLDFDGGKFFATLRLCRGNRGMLEVVVFTSYSMKNETDFPIYVLATKRWPLSRIEIDNLNSNIPSELGLCLLPKSTRSWFLKSERVQLKLLEDHTSEALLDLGSLSGLTEISFKKEEGSGIKSVTKLGVSVGPSSGEIVVPSQMVTLVPRYVICNESEESITVRQFYFQDEVLGVISINSKQQMPLQLKEGFSKKREFSVFEHFIRKHRISSDNSLLYIQIQTNEPGLGWSGPVCIASLGHFFLKFRKQSNEVTTSDNKMTQFAAVHVVEEGSTLVLSFYKPPNLSLPYRIENCLHSLSITYYQKDSLEPEVLGPACSADYVWDDLTLPRRLVVRINGTHLNLVIDSCFTI
ncbi:Vacuolar protein sorting-associated protein 13, SHR-binding domain [Sesbania bispinosa]|nr:Vacuolar protein sorting-associated protein 13, SHR-binding domain [Sesbania bispinosa]